MKRLLVSIPALFCFAATAAIVMPWSQANPVVLSFSGASQTQGKGLKLELPAPTGPHQIGRAALHLVDKSRTDSLAPTPRSRELMIQIWYPTNNADRYPPAPYKPAGLATIAAKRLNRVSGAQFPDDFLTFPTHSRQGAPVKSGKWPIILFSPAAGVPVTDYTGLNEDLASRGFVVVGIDHTFDATVEFPGGRIETRPAGFDPERIMPVRLGDVRFVLDQLTQLTAGANPDAGRAALPQRLGRALDLRRVGMFGHSFGSPTTAQSMLEDRRIGAGAAMDGSILPKRPGRTPWGIEKKDLDRPFLLMGSVKHRRSVDKEGWREFWEQMRAERLWLVIQGAGHYDFNDTGVFSEQVDLSKMFYEELMLGPIDGRRALTIVRAYLSAWFDHTLRDRSEQLLLGPSSEFPEVEFDR
jgi:predicted dienelactone hydrolase